jgi:hypothetical protein
MDKIADRPHRWNVLLSLAAIAISTASLWEAHQARLINAQASQALLQVTAVTADRGPNGFSWDDPSAFLSLNVGITVTNLGKAMASEVEVHCNAEQVGRDIKYNGFERSCFGKLQPLGPSRSYRELMSLILGPREFRSTEKSISGFVIYGVLHYRDNITGQNRDEQWCYEAPPFHAADQTGPEFLPCYDRKLN